MNEENFFQGSTTLGEKIEKIVEEVVSKVSLKKYLTFEQFRRLFFEIKEKIDGSDCSKYSFFVVPLSNESSASVLAVAPQLEQLLMLLKTLLDSRQCKDIVQFCLNEFINRIFDVSRRARGDEWFLVSSSAANADLGNSKGIPLAKLIPLVSDCFHTISQSEFDSVIHNLLVSASLREFCVKIFEKDLIADETH